MSADETSASSSAGRNESTIRVKLLRRDGSGVDVREVHSSEFEASDKGVTLERLFVPWRRVQSYASDVRTPADDDRARHARVSVRLVVDDGSPGGKTYTVTADRFETGPWSITLVVDRRAEPDRGELVAERIVFPWGRVIEFERLISDEMGGLTVSWEPVQTPARPDA
jgi:hypothetical protein